MRQLKCWQRGLLTLALLAGGAAAAAGGDVEFMLGQDQWQPGSGYRPGTDWLALNCVKTACSLEPARLSVRKEQWQGHYDDKPTAGQKLVFSRLKPGAGTVIAWFRQDPAKPWLVPGPVNTYAASTVRMKRPASQGTLELAVDLPSGGQASLVPLLDKAESRFMLQLRVPGKRQMLGELSPCSHTVDTSYLVWAGDLDRDGRPDYLVSLIDADGEAMLLLGGRAEGGEIAGRAGAYRAPPFGGECDGSGWLQ